MSDSVEPSHEELSAITQLGRLNRMLAQGISPLEAALKLTVPETADAYVRRNEEAMAALETRMLSQEYLARFAEIQAESDPVRKAILQAELKRANFAEIDMEAVHRTIRARNRQWKAEGILPPDAPI